MKTTEQERTAQVEDAISTLVFAALNARDPELKPHIIAALDRINGYIFDAAIDDIDTASSHVAQAITTNTQSTLTVDLIEAWNVLRAVTVAARVALGTTGIDLLRETTTKH